jgi:hypothetical protein
MKTLILFLLVAVNASAQTNVIFPQLLSATNTVLMTNAEFRCISGNRIFFLSGETYKVFRPSDLTSNELAALHLSADKLNATQAAQDKAKAQAIFDETNVPIVEGTVHGDDPIYNDSSLWPMTGPEISLDSLYRKLKTCDVDDLNDVVQDAIDQVEDYYQPRIKSAKFLTDSFPDMAEQEDSARVDDENAVYRLARKVMEYRRHALKQTLQKIQPPQSFSNTN